jgi:hypothetical protein
VCSECVWGVVLLPQLSPLGWLEATGCVLWPALERRLGRMEGAREVVSATPHFHHQVYPSQRDLKRGWGRPAGGARGPVAELGTQQPGTLHIPCHAPWVPPATERGQNAGEPRRRVTSKSKEPAWCPLTQGLKYTWDLKSNDFMSGIKEGSHHEEDHLNMERFCYGFGSLLSFLLFCFF